MYLNQFLYFSKANKILNLTCDIKQLDFYFGITFSIMQVLNFLFGTIVNLWFILTIFDNKKLRSSKYLNFIKMLVKKFLLNFKKRYIGIISLSLVDVSLCLVVSPLQIIRELVSINENMSLDPKVCSIITFVSSWLCLSSILSLTLISIERYIVFKTNRHLRKELFLIYILIAHLISFIYALLNTAMDLLDSSVMFSRCSNNYMHSINLNNFKLFNFMFKTLFIIIGLICLISTTYCYYVIYKIIRNKQMIRLKLNGLITISSKKIKMVRIAHNRS